AECWPPYGECDRAKSKSRWRQRCNQHPKTGQSIEIGSRRRSRMARAEISDHVGTASLAGKSRAKTIRLGFRRPCMRGQPPKRGRGLQASIRIQACFGTYVRSKELSQRHDIVADDSSRQIPCSCCVREGL